MDLFKQANNADVLHVSYKGAQFAVTDLIAGYIDVAAASIAAVAPFHRSGRVRAIVVAGPERSPSLPDVMSAPESGMPGLQLVGWYAVVAPTGTPTEIVVRLNNEINKALLAADVKERLASAGLTPGGSTVAELAALMRDDYERLGKAVEASGAKAN